MVYVELLYVIVAMSNKIQEIYLIFTVSFITQNLFEHLLFFSKYFTLLGCYIKQHVVPSLINVFIMVIYLLIG